MQSGIRKLQSKNSQYSGFTLIELLVAIGIIAVLAGLLLSGIGAATGTVATAKAANEIASLETALAQFHSEFGMYPPSQIVLHETATGWANTDANTVRSLALIRKMWPSFAVTGTMDLNGDGTIQAEDEPLMLSGTECLVFFLGGVIRDGAPIGFSKNPANPFSKTGDNRVGPFHEFVLSRMVDTDGDAVAEYVDTYSGQQTPILYLNSYDGRGYRPAELPPGMANVYYQNAAGTLPWKNKTYQLISPGIDGLYGIGGYYDPDGPGTIGPEDQDNLTNFSSGKLK